MYKLIFLKRIYLVFIGLIVAIIAPFVVSAGPSDIICGGTTPAAIATCEQTCLANGGTPSTTGTSCATVNGPVGGSSTSGGINNTGGTIGGSSTSGGQNGTPSTTAAPFEPVFLQNPLAGTVNDIPSFIKELLQIALIIGTPLVVLAIIYAGFLMVAAQGNPEKLEKARSALLWAVIGGAVLLGSYVIAQAIGATIEQITG